jgi:hypothetical protein
LKYIREPSKTSYFILFKKLSVLFLFLLGVVLVSYTTVDRNPILNNLESKAVFIDTLSFNEGPSIFVNGEHLIEKNITNGVLASKSLAFETLPTQFNTEPSACTKVSKITTLSEIHARYGVTTTLLKNNNIIDASEKWAYGDGYFVIVGDGFDREPQVTELLWLIFKLVKQAEQAGGKMHYLLGNHEYMLMLNELRYINKKHK